MHLKRVSMHLDTIPVLDERVRGDEVKEWKSTYKKDKAAECCE